MGIIQKQTIKTTIYSYAGVGIGFITTGWLLPQLLSTGENGIIKLLLSYSLLLGQLASLGFNSVVTRLFPYFRNESNKHHGFLGIALWVTLVGCVFSSFIFWGLEISGLFESKNTPEINFTKYAHYLLPLLWVTAFFFLFDNYYKVLYNAAIGTLYKDVVQRLLILVAILIFAAELTSFHGFINLYVLAYALPTFILAGLLARSGEFRLKIDRSHLSPSLTRSMFSVSLFGIIVSFSNLAIMNIDSIMINRMIGLDETGVYGITFFFGTLIIIPARVVRKVSSAVLAESWKSGDLTAVREIYTRSSLNQLILGQLLFVGIWANIENIFELLPQEYAAGKFVILFIGLSNLIEMAAGISGTIINTSKYYRFMTLFMALMLGAIVLTNFLFIPRWGISGAAFASTLSTLLFVGMRAHLLWRKYRMHPFKKRHLFVLLIGVFCLAINWLLPAMENYIIDIIIRSSLIGLTYLFLIYTTKASDEITGKIDELLNLLLKK